MLLHQCFFFSSRRRHTRWTGDWSSDVCSSDLAAAQRSRTHRLGYVGAAITPEVVRDINAFTRGARQFDPAIVVEVRWLGRSEERRVGKECRSRWSAYHEEKKRKGSRTTSNCTR